MRLDCEKTKSCNWCMCVRKQTHTLICKYTPPPSSPADNRTQMDKLKSTQSVQRKETQLVCYKWIHYVHYKYVKNRKKLLSKLLIC
uniref:Uncharacterized protein n=1 Tax=Anopheles arabiensis TaxID=7173 RepID=A0A182IFL3_ANOAR